MKDSAKRYRTFFYGLFFTFLLLGVFPLEMVISTLLFLAISYGGVILIKIATSYDNKMKKADKV